MSFFLKFPLLNKSSSPSSLVKIFAFISPRHKPAQGSRGNETIQTSLPVVPGLGRNYTRKQQHKHTTTSAQEGFDCVTAKHPSVLFSSSSERQGRLLNQHTNNPYVQTLAEDTISLGVKSSLPLRIKIAPRDCAKLNLKSINRP